MEDLYAMSEAELPTYDIAELSLLAARGLPGADDLHVERYLSVLNLWARRIQTQTNKHGGVFRSDPGKFDNSEGFWRMLALTATLRDEFNIRYNMERIEKEDWSDSRDGLIHGLLGPNRTGTCSSLPVLLVAIGRRLGYPLFLVCTIGHLFVRWSSADKNERFNVEFNGDGMSRHPDQYYREWPAKWTPEFLALEEQRGEECAFLRNLTPAEEFAHALCMRGHCLEAAGRWEEATEAYEAAARFGPTHPAYPVYAKELKTKMNSADDLMAQVIAQTPNFDPELPAFIGVQTKPVPRGFTIALSYKQLPDGITPFDPSVKPPSGISPALFSIRNIVSEIHAKNHPLADFKPVTPPSEPQSKGIEHGWSLHCEATRSQRRNAAVRC